MINIACPFCSSLSSTIDTLNTSVAGAALELTNQLGSSLNASQQFLIVKQQITEATQSFFDTIESVNSSVVDIKNQTKSYMNTAETYDKQRQDYGFIFFVIPLCWVVFPVIGILVKHKCCFKLLSVCTIYILLCLFLSFVCVCVWRMCFCVLTKIS